MNYAEADKGNVKIFKSGAMEEDDEYQPGNYSDYAPSSGMCCAAMSWFDHMKIKM